MRLTLCGVRGSTPAPGSEFVRYGGHTSCVAVAHDGEIPTLLLDAGTGLRRVWKLLEGGPFRGAILLSHLHWDHTHGLPFFRGGDDPDARVDLYLPAQGDDAEAVLSRGMSPPHFPIRPAQLRGEWRFHGLEEGRHEIGGFDVLAREIPHKGGRTFGYRVSDGRTSIAYLADHHPYAFGGGPTGYGVVHDAAAELITGVDVLLHDAQYTSEDFASRADFGHSAIEYVVDLAETCDVATTVFFHHDPARTDVELDAIAGRFEGGNRRIVVGVEGQTFDTASGTLEDPRHVGAVSPPST